MSEPKWTRGEWRFEASHPMLVDTRYAVIMADRTIIIGINSKLIPQHDRERSEANAHLIAAAPELYEALEEARLAVERIDRYRCSAIFPYLQSGNPVAPL